MEQKSITVRFYTDSGIYKGWQYVSKTTFREVLNWLRSGNYCKIKKETLNGSTSTTKILNIFNK